MTEQTTRRQRGVASKTSRSQVKPENKNEFCGPLGWFNEGSAERSTTISGAIHDDETERVVFPGRAWEQHPRKPIETL